MVTLTLIEAFARHDGRALSTVSRLASGDGRTYARLKGGHTITVRRAARIAQWISDHWPVDADWPAGIERPPPGLGTLSVDALLDGRRAAARVSVAAIQPYEEELWRRARALDENGIAAAPRLLTRMCRANRETWNYVLGRYANGRGGESKPRPVSGASRLLRELVAMGDARFRHRGRSAA